MGRKKKNRNNKQNVKADAPSSTPPVSMLKQTWFWSVASFFVALGFPYGFPNADSAPAVYFGWFLWSLPLTLFAVGL
jgi:hypothetical protein